MNNNIAPMPTQNPWVWAPNVGLWITVAANIKGPGIRGTQIKSSGNKNRMSPLRRLDGAYFSETPPSWHVRPYFSLIAIVNY
jgi:hypothetical protein